jgi:glycine betaine/proline transport system substrate-binding protein
MTLSRRSLLIAGAGALASGAARSQAGAEPKIVLGQVALSFYAVAGAVVQEIPERLGHTVEIVQGPHEEMFPLLAEGGIDLMAAVWLPEGHGAYWARYGASAIEITRLYDGARFFWAVPSYVPEELLASMEHLAKPAVMERITKHIQGIGPGATITVISRKAIEDYGLGQFGYSLKVGTQVEWTGALYAAVAEQRWIVFPTWAPQYLNRNRQLRALADPRGVLGGANHASLVAPRERFEALPARTRATLQRIDLAIEAVTEMDWMVNAGSRPPRDAARMWMALNEGRVAGWLQA